ncbi:hypothetical protein BOTBODRAFT_569890 [Botryobasidium botryosum FD-172 SS1]|uniref:non-specific serine/threonine protein kinase n=1 Tax=Botryobasidium botryosum (strain FD-172 SS1) TaxID=930990 RepID=A0A067M8P3_BOTB1|nr:hypothetical protein BOTBODRAFT_569890 [Botryobasidium botryosum FD-172 SS1]
MATSTLQLNPPDGAFTSDVSALISGYVGTAPSSGRVEATQEEVNNKFTLINTLCGHLDRLFSSPGAWKPERSMIILCLNLVQHVHMTYENVFQVGDAPHRRWLSCFLKIAACINASEVDDDSLDDSHSQDEVKNKVLDACVSMLRTLSSHTMLGRGREHPAWMIARECFDELLALAKDLSSFCFTSTPAVSVILFRAPRVQEVAADPFEQTQEPSFVLQNSRQALMMYFDALVVLSKALTPSNSADPFLSITARRTIGSVCAAFESLRCMPPNSDNAFADDTERFVRLLHIAGTLMKLPISHTSSLEPWICRVLMRRVFEGPKEEWEKADEALFKLLDTFPDGAKVTIDVSSMLERLKEEDWSSAAPLQDALYACLRRAVSEMPLAFLSPLHGHLSRNVPNPSADVLQQDIRTRLAALTISHPAEEIAATLGKRKRSEGCAWKQRIEDEVGTQFFDGHHEWLSVEGNETDSQWLEKVVQAIQKKCLGSLSDPTLDGRIAMAKQLFAIPCLLAHPLDPECLTPSQVRAVVVPNLVPMFEAVATALFGSSTSTVTAELRRRIYDALAPTIRHGYLRDTLLEQFHSFLADGLKAEERAVRISAGKAFAELMRGYQTREGDSSTVIVPPFRSLERILLTGKDHLKETTLVTVGLIGKLAKDKLLGLVLCCLIAQLDHKNTLLKSLAYVQLMNLAKHHQKSPYSLILPFMVEISQYVVIRLCTEPGLLRETCRFLSREPAGFLTLTLPHTLPILAAARAKDVIDTISDQLGKTSAVLLLDKSAEVLAHIFLLDGSKQTEQAYEFVRSIITKAAPQGSVGDLSLVRHCAFSLLGEIAIFLGDEDKAQTQRAIKALQKVERKFTAPGPRQRAAPVVELAEFIHQHILAIMSHMNEALRDVHGKKSEEYKKQIIRSIGVLVDTVGPPISTVSPQIMATLQTALLVDFLIDVTLQSWAAFVNTLSLQDVSSYVGSTTAAFVNIWPKMSPTSRRIAIETIDYLIIEHGEEIRQNLSDIVSLDGIPELSSSNRKLKALRRDWSFETRLHSLRDRSKSENSTVAAQALKELKEFMRSDDPKMQELAIGDTFSPDIVGLVRVLFTAACRDGEGAEEIRLLAFECLGALGALDPDRFELPPEEGAMILLKNFTDETETVKFATHLIIDVLVGAFRSTSDTQYQSHLALAIQELLKICGFTSELVLSDRSGGAIPLRVRNRWEKLPKHVLETVTPLLDGKYSIHCAALSPAQLPVYAHVTTYREWIQVWAAHLISKVSGMAQRIFEPFRLTIRNQDVGVARHLLPHLVLNVLISGREREREDIRQEILTVLQDQIQLDSKHTSDMRLLSAQIVFLLMDHLSKWLRMVRQDMNKSRSEAKRTRNSTTRELNQQEDQLVKVDSMISSIDYGLTAQAAFQCKAYARALMTFEQHITSRQERGATQEELQSGYERLHEIYAHLDEPDGMEGISTRVISPSIEHQIREHESTGRWTSAQSCWEIRLQENPHDVDLHIGLLRCLRNLGHYDTLRTHIKGILSRNPGWETSLLPFEVEGAWMVGDWKAVEDLCGAAERSTPELTIGRLLLSLRAGEPNHIAQAFSVARNHLGDPISAAGTHSYRRSYDSMISLHLVHELQEIYNAAQTVSRNVEQWSQLADEHPSLDKLSKLLSARLDATLPTFRAREPILSMRRIAFSLCNLPAPYSRREIGYAWLCSSKLARKAGHSQTAYSAMLQARQWDAPYAFIQRTKLLRSNGEGLRALQELENALQALTPSNGVIDLTGNDEPQNPKLKAKAFLLQARWMEEADRFDANEIVAKFRESVALVEKWESPLFHLGHYHDRCLAQTPEVDRELRGAAMTYQICKHYAKALLHGSKYIYQTMPRMLTLWLDMGEEDDLVEVSNARQTDSLQSRQVFLIKINGVIESVVRKLSSYQWLTAFPQIVSRVGHPNKGIYLILSRLMVSVLHAYPHQALWLFTSVLKSRKSDREKRGISIINQVKSHPVSQQGSVAGLVNQWMGLSTELLALSDFAVKGDERFLSMKTTFPKLTKLAPSSMILPLQSSMIVSLPPRHATDGTSHQPFPSSAPTFHQFLDEVEIMTSLQKPRKINVQGSDGVTYHFLCKPKDDLRKDARLMDFNSMINKLLKTNSESRRRQLRQLPHSFPPDLTEFIYSGIRTYGVVPLNEECGLIEWVPNTTGMRHILTKSYAARDIALYTKSIGDALDKAKRQGERAAGQAFVRDVLPQYPVVFHEWFIATFPEPSAWLAARLAYARTAAVMSMVGFVLGLGDRHGENILLDSVTGDTVHVDFNCLFDKGKTFEIPERVPFRLTSNVVDGLGVTGVEGVFRIACEITMQLLRDHKDSLMSVLEAFVHDPLVEWEDEKRRKEREVKMRSKGGSKRGNPVAEGQVPQLRELARKSLLPIERKLRGVAGKHDKEIKTSNQVEALIKEATDPINFAMMYIGWAAWL